MWVYYTLALLESTGRALLRVVMYKMFSFSMAAPELSVFAGYSWTIVSSWSIFVWMRITVDVSEWQQIRMRTSNVAR